MSGTKSAVLTPCMTFEFSIIQLMNILIENNDDLEPSIYYVSINNFGLFLNHPSTHLLCRHKYSTGRQQNLPFCRPTYPVDVIYGWSLNYLYSGRKN